MTLTLDQLPTPSFVVDRDVVSRNCSRIREKAESAAVFFRPHVKTHKTIEIAKLQHGGSRGAITVSTMAEAEFFAAGGFTDITYAVPIAPNKLDRAASLTRRIGRFHVLIDSPLALSALQQHGETRGVRFNVFLKIDCGYHRAGVDPDDPASITLALDVARSTHVRLKGFLTHAGHSYHATSREEIAKIAREEADAVDRFARRFEAAGGKKLIRSVGSTPTISVVETLPPCDEVRPGNYVFYDAFQAAVGSCDLRDCAATVIASVISVDESLRKIVIDAGALALSKDAGATHLPTDPGFGVVCDLELRPLENAKLRSLSQEHGVIELAAAPPVKVGDKLRIVPNHSCLTAAMYDRYFVVERANIVDEWKPVRGW